MTTPIKATGPSTVITPAASDAPQQAHTTVDTQRALDKSLHHWSMRADVWFEPNKVIGMVNHSIKALEQQGQVVLSDDCLKANGYELRAVVDALRGMGHVVDLTEEGFYKRITEIRVTKS